MGQSRRGNDTCGGSQAQITVKDLKTILKVYNDIPEGEEIALATVVKVRGSSYRAPGARMLIRQNGHWTGAISGGCLEGDALKQARSIIASKHPRLVTYDTTEEGNRSLGVSLGCNGIIDVLIEPLVAHQEDLVMKSLARFVNTKKITSIATVFSDSEERHLGKRVFYQQDSGFKTTADAEQLEEQMLEEAILALKERTPSIKKLSLGSSEYDVFIELLEPPINLLIHGGGFDVQPVSRIAQSLGWEVMVTDECVAHSAPNHFPFADKVVHAQRHELDDKLKTDEYTAAILMSHNFGQDLAALKFLLNTDVRYIGMLGPLKRFEKMKSALLEEDIILEQEDLARVYAPVGLDLGAESPEEIALSILAEIQACFSGHKAGFLKDKSGPIHERFGKEEMIFKKVISSKKIDA